ncbi:MAG: enoyl-CoA hydratase/isomerase family protein [Anaerolineae bacterium]|nr:enoyl-CoA hydratase/isomerase family protein [Anaerolineae bacterium]
MSERQFVKMTIEERIAILTIDHPPVNAFNAATMMELDGALDEAMANPDVKVLIITGAGPNVFVAGADINEIARLGDGANEGDARRMLLKGQAVFSKVESARKPVIAAINGACIGGGLELAMACHIRLASDRARLGQTEINLGIIPGWGGTQRLPRILGKGKALELILTGDLINAQEAYRLGLVNKVVPGDALIKEAKGLAKKIASKSAVAIAAALAAVDHSGRLSLADGLLYEVDRFLELTQTHDMREGVTAFLQKRQPIFQDK